MAPAANPPPIHRVASGDYEVDLDRGAVELVLRLCDELETLLDSDSPLLVRLFPPPYEDDEERNAGFSVLAMPELIEKRKQSLTIIRDTADAKLLTEEQLSAWMRSTNDIRLVLGTFLGVQDDSEDLDVDPEQAETYGAYEFMGALLELIVQALSS